MSGYTSTELPADLAEELAASERNRKFAEKLQAQSGNMPQGQMVSGIYVKPSMTQYLAQALQGVQARQMANEADKKRLGVSDAYGKRMADVLGRAGQAMQGTPEIPSPPDELGGGPFMPAQPGDPKAAQRIMLESGLPAIQNQAMAQMLKGMEPKKPIVVGRTLMDETGKQIGVDSTWQAEQQAAREARKAEIEQKLADQRTSREEQAALRRELAASASADRRFIAGMVNARQEQKNVPKLPTSALKMQQEELDAIGTASAINADLGAMGQQIESGKLQLGPVNNLMAKAKNMVGASDESSRNLATFQATLEKLRNDSLRLNKGVQTEGDAQRAWNEMIANINDPKLVKQRLAEIQKINERGANLRRMNVETIRSNFGVDPMDTSPRQNLPAAVGGGGSSVDALLKKYGG